MTALTLAFELRFLNGNYHADRAGGGPEWPPNPARIWYALIDAWFRRGKPGAARAALLWLERQPPPEIRATERTGRAGHTTWRPINEVGSWMPDAKRETQVDAWVACGNEPVVYRWRPDDAPPAGVADALETLAAGVTRVGTSESLCALRMRSGLERKDLPAAPAGVVWLVPSPDDEYGETWLRTPKPDGLQEIELWGLARPGRESPYRETAYHRAGDGPPRAWIAAAGLEEGACSAARGPRVMKRIRAALVRYADHDLDWRPVDPVIHGHGRDGGPGRDHLQIVPLVHVGTPNASGRLIGVAFVVPDNVPVASRAYAEDVVRRWLRARRPVYLLDEKEEKESLHRGHLTFGPTDGRWTLHFGRWTRPARKWRTVIPMELPRCVGSHYVRRQDGTRRLRGWSSRDWRQANQAVRLAVEHAGFPEPDDVRTDFTSADPAAPSCAETQGPARKTLVHAEITWPEEIPGPVVIGSGRHHGYGLMEPTFQQRRETGDLSQ